MPTRYTTCTHNIYLPKETDLQSILWCSVVYCQQDQIVVEKIYPDDSEITKMDSPHVGFIVKLAPSDTKLLKEGTVDIQLAYKTESGDVTASKIVTKKVSDVLDAEDWLAGKVS